MLPKYKNKNSWILSVENKASTKYNHYYFCSCTKEFNIQTEINEQDAPEMLCPSCGNDYFKDAVVFEEMKNTKIWKYFKWSTVVYEYDDCWSIKLRYKIPTHNVLSDKINFIDKNLLKLELKKDGSMVFQVSSQSNIMSKYSLFLDDKVQSFRKLLLDDAKEHLYNYIMINRSETIEWVDKNDIKDFSPDDKLNYLTFFLKNQHLREHEFFFWKMRNLHTYTIEHSSQIQMLDLIANNRKEKSIKKALFRGYRDSINNNKEYYPYSDFVFSRTIDDANMLVKFYEIFPAIKQHIFTDETFLVGIGFIEFLKRYYTEKQIVKLFVQEMQDEINHKTVVHNWIDTLRMIQEENAFTFLEEHFSKVKLTSIKLHNEIVRVFHIYSYELDSKESFEYDDVYKHACVTYGEFQFKLPSTVAELSLWSKKLHNCMFGYSINIHKQSSIIYGVFKDETLLYAVELSNFNIIQAKANSNREVPQDDMKSIRRWKSEHFLT